MLRIGITGPSSYHQQARECQWSAPTTTVHLHACAAQLNSNRLGGQQKSNLDTNAPEIACTKKEIPAR